MRATDVIVALETVYQHLLGLAHTLGIDLQRDVLLDVHEPSHALLLHLGRYICGRVVGRSASLGLDSEHPCPLETHVLEKLAELLEVGLGLAREAHDEGGTESDVRHMFTHILHKTDGLLAVHATAHIL